MKILVNNHWLWYVWGPITNGHEVDSLAFIDITDPEDLKSMCSLYIKPYFSDLPNEQYHRIKETWRYGLVKYDDELLRRELRYADPPFDSPEDIRRFYSDVWLYTFNGEPWHTFDFKDYIDIDTEEYTPWDGILLTSHGEIN